MEEEPTGDIKTDGGSCCFGKTHSHNLAVRDVTIVFFLVSDPMLDSKNPALHLSTKPKSATLGWPSPGYPNVLSNSNAEHAMRNSAILIQGNSVPYF